MKQPYDMTDAEIAFFLQNDVPESLEDDLLEERNLRRSCAYDSRVAQAMGRAYGPDNEPS